MVPGSRNLQCLCLGLRDSLTGTSCSSDHSSTPCLQWGGLTLPVPATPWLTLLRSARCRLAVHKPRLVSTTPQRCTHLCRSLTCSAAACRCLCWGLHICKELSLHLIFAARPRPHRPHTCQMPCPAPTPASCGWAPYPCLRPAQQLLQPHSAPGRQQPDCSRPRPGLRALAVPCTLAVTGWESTQTET